MATVVLCAAGEVLVLASVLGAEVLAAVTDVVVTMSFIVVKGVCGSAVMFSCVTCELDVNAGVSITL